MKKTNKNNTEISLNQEAPLTISAQNEPVLDRQKVFEVATHGWQNLENAHPGITRKVSCVTVIGLSATLIADAIVVLSA